jgi:thioredoxin-related protein
MFSITMIAQTNFRAITYKQALEAAKTENKLVFMDFYTDWCGPCKLMAREVFPTKTVGNYFNEKFVSLKVNAEKGEGIALAKKYAPKAYPTFVVIDAQENEVFRTSGYSPTDEFIELIKRLMDPSLTPEKMQQMYESGNRSASLIKAYAAYMMEELNESGLRGDSYTARRKEIIDIVQNYFETLTDNQKLSEENIFVYRNYTPRTTDPAARYMYAHKGEFGDNNADIDSTMQALYDSNLYSYVAGHISYDVTKFQTFVAELKQLGYNNNGKYNLAIQFVEAATKDMNSHLSFFDNQFSSLEDDYKYAAMSGIVNRYSKEDKTTKRKASQSIRNKMPDMDSNMLYNAFEYISQLER